MADVNLTLKGKNQASPAIKQVEGDLSKLDQAANRASTGLSGMASLAGAAGFLALAAGAGKGALELTKIGEAAVGAQKRFEAFAGGSDKVVGTIAAFRSEMQGGIDDTTALATASGLISMGLAQTGEEAAHVSRMAAMLGSSMRTAEDKVSDFSMLLANQSIRRLDQFGISADQVRDRVEELKAANSELGDQQAFVNAVLEIGDERLKQLEASGVRAATATQELSTAWTNMVSAIGTATATQTGGFLQGLTDLMNGITGAIQRGSGDPLTESLGIQTAIDNLNQWKDVWADLAEQGDKVAQLKLDEVNAQIEDLERQLSEATEATKRMGSTAATEGARAEGAFRGAAKAAGELAEQVGRESWRDRALAAEIADQAYDKEVKSYVQKKGEAFTEARLDGEEQARRLAETEASEQQRAAERSRAAWESEMSRMAGTLKGFFSTGIQASINLKSMVPGGSDTGWLEPGAGGPFESIYRLQAWLNDGSWAETAEGFGLDQDKARSIVEKFQRGIFDADVQSVIDKDQLVEMLRLQEMAQASQDAFAEQLAGLSGVSKGKVVSALFGMSTGDEGESATKEIAEGAVGKLLDTVGAVFDNPATLTKLQGKGEQAWRGLESGILSAAQTSTVLYDAVEAMVNNVLNEALK